MTEVLQGSAADLAYESQGDGDVLLLVHGFPLDRSMWVAQREALSDSRRVIVPDLRGFGESPEWRSDDPLTMARHADDLAAMLDALQIDAVHLAGLSMGGYIAFEFWRRHADRLTGLALLDTKAAADTDQAKQNREQVATAASSEARTAELAVGMVPKLLAAESLSDPDLASAITQTKRVMAATAPKTFAAAQRGMAARDDFTNELPNIHVPCLVLCGSGDAITPPDVVRAMAEQLPNATYVEVAGAGHLPPIEQPSAVNQAMRTWLG